MCWKGDGSTLATSIFVSLSLIVDLPGLSLWSASVTDIDKVGLDFCTEYFYHLQSLMSKTRSYNNHHCAHTLVLAQFTSTASIGTSLIVHSPWTWLTRQARESFILVVKLGSYTHIIDCSYTKSTMDDKGSPCLHVYNHISKYISAIWLIMTFCC